MAVAKVAAAVLVAAAMAAVRTAAAMAAITAAIMAAAAAAAVAAARPQAAPRAIWMTKFRFDVDRIQNVNARKIDKLTQRADSCQPFFLALKVRPIFYFERR